MTAFHRSRKRRARITDATISADWAMVGRDMCNAVLAFEQEQWPINPHNSQGCHPSKS